MWANAQCVQHVSDLHSKFALGPHDVWKYGDIQSATAENRQNKEDRRQKRTKI